MEPKKSFWETLPGFLTATSGILGAIAAVLTALYTTGVIGHRGEQMPSQPGFTSASKSDVAPSPLSVAGNSSTNEPDTLPADELKKLEPSEEGGVWVTQGPIQKVHYTVYNGSSYKLKEITIRIICVDLNVGVVIFDSDVTLPLDSESSGEPFENSKFSRYDVFPRELIPYRTEAKGFIRARGTRVSSATP